MQKRSTYETIALDEDLGEKLNVLLGQQSNDKKQYQQTNNENPTEQEIKNSIKKITQKFPKINLQRTVEILYKRLIVSSQPKKHIAKKALSQYQHHQKTQKRNGENDVIDDPNRPKFTVRQITPKGRSKNTKIQHQDRDWLKEKPQDREDKKINQQVWERFNRNKQDKTDKISTISKVYKQSNEDNFRITQAWKFTVQNKSFRLYCSKVAPKFNSKDEEMKFFQKRLAAQAFCNRGRQLAQVDQDYFELAYQQYNATSDASINRDLFPTLAQIKPFRPKGPAQQYPDVKRYKAVSTAFIADTLRKLQIFIMEKVDKRIRPFTGPQMRVIFSILLNAQNYFPQQEYIIFRRFVKITFHLGSATIYQNPSMSLFRSIQLYLKERLNQGQSDNQSMASQYYSAQQWRNIMMEYAESVGVADIQEGLNANEIGQFINHCDKLLSLLYFLMDNKLTHLYLN